MKKIFNLRSVIALILSVTALLAIAVMPISASVAPPVEWELSADDTTLTNDRGNTFTAYNLPAGYVTDFKLKYYFANEVDAKNTAWGTSSVVSYANDGKIIYLPNLQNQNGYTYESIFVDNEAKGYLDALVTGEAELLRIYSSKRFMYADMSRDFLDGIAASSESAEAMSYDVPLLSSQIRYDIFAYDVTDSIRGAYGAIYEIDGAYYFVDYRTLGNNYFDSDGNFSYRAGTIELIPLDKAASDAVDAMMSELTVIERDSEYEDFGSSNYNPITGDDQQTFEIVMFWIIFVIFGYLLPAVPLALGLIFYLKRKRENPIHWLIVACIGAAWILISLILTIIIALV